MRGARGTSRLTTELQTNRATTPVAIGWRLGKSDAGRTKNTLSDWANLEKPDAHLYEVVYSSTKRQTAIEENVRYRLRMAAVSGSWSGSGD
jgi:hypothetical protein